MKICHLSGVCNFGSQFSQPIKSPQILEIPIWNRVAAIIRRTISMNPKQLEFGSCLVFFFFFLFSVPRYTYGEYVIVILVREHSERSETSVYLIPVSFHNPQAVVIGKKYFSIISLVVNCFVFHDRNGFQHKNERGEK